MEDWYHIAVNYPGTEPEGFEAWFWHNVLGYLPYLPPLPGFQLILPEAELPSYDGSHGCFYPGCSKVYRTRQNRESEFKPVILF